MITPLRYLLTLSICTILLSFKMADHVSLDFAYPKDDKTAIAMQGEGFKKFKKEWRGHDYYYMSDSENGIICSVLYFKLNEQEQAETIKEFGDKTSAQIPLTYFTATSNFKSMERRNEKWGNPEDDFNFRQNDIELGGPAIKQKNMYGYAMFGKDLFVNIHLSKMACSPADSTEMRAMLQSLVKKVK